MQHKHGVLSTCKSYNLCTISDVILNRKTHGPAFTLEVPFPESRDPDMTSISIDLSPQLPIKSQFAPFIGWPRAGAKWPSREKVEAIRAIGINATAKRPMEWMRCYAACEKELMNNIDSDGGCRKKCHRIMKAVREEFWCKTTKPAISSFILKVKTRQNKKQKKSMLYYGNLSPIFLS